MPSKKFYLEHKERYRKSYMKTSFKKVIELIEGCYEEATNKDVILGISLAGQAVMKEALRRGCVLDYMDSLTSSNL